jgi:hypothetical protein
VVSAGGERDLRLGEVEDAERSGMWWLWRQASASPAPARWRLQRKIRRPRRSGGSGVVVAHRWRVLLCFIFLLFFLLFVVRVRVRRTTMTSLFALRLQRRRTAKPAATVANGMPLGNFFCRARAMTHDKGCLSCVRCKAHDKDRLPCNNLSCGLCRAFIILRRAPETHNKGQVSRSGLILQRAKSWGKNSLPRLPLLPKHMVPFSLISVATYATYWWGRALAIFSICFLLHSMSWGVLSLRSSSFFIHHI